MIPDTFTINSIAKNITFIPLETTDESLLMIENFKIMKMNDYYYITSSRDRECFNIMEFDSSGRFNKYLIQRGQGPQELPIITFWSINRNAQLLFASTTSQVLIHSFEHNTKNRFLLRISF